MTAAGLEIVLPGFLNVHVGTGWFFAMNLEGRWSYRGSAPGGEDPLASRATFPVPPGSGLCHHEFTQKHQAGNFPPQEATALLLLSLWVSSSTGGRGVVWGYLSGQAAHAMGLYPPSSPTFIMFQLQTCNQRCELEVAECNLAGSQSLITHLSFLSHFAFRPFTYLLRG